MNKPVRSAHLSVESYQANKVSLPMLVDIKGLVPVKMKQGIGKNKNVPLMQDI